MKNELTFDDFIEQEFGSDVNFWKQYAKWLNNAYDDELHDYITKLENAKREFDFDTPWVPPYKWIEALFSKYQNEYIEIVTDWEDGFVTICKNDNGKLVEEDITPPEEDEE